MSLFYDKTNLADILSVKLKRPVSSQEISKSIPCRNGENCWIDGERHYVPKSQIIEATTEYSYQVYHRQRTKDNCELNGERCSIFESDNPPQSLGEYIAIATVTVKGATVGQRLGRVYQLSQNLEDCWLNNEGVAPIVPMLIEARSTSVNDLILDVQNNQYYLVASVGFKAIKIEGEPRQFKS